jgi:hypothetical protein
MLIILGLNVQIPPPLFPTMKGAFMAIWMALVPRMRASSYLGGVGNVGGRWGVSAELSCTPSMCQPEHAVLEEQGVPVALALCHPQQPHSDQDLCCSSFVVLLHVCSAPDLHCSVTTLYEHKNLATDSVRKHQLVEQIQAAIEAQFEGTNYCPLLGALFAGTCPGLL